MIVPKIGTVFVVIWNCVSKSELNQKSKELYII